MPATTSPRKRHPVKLAQPTKGRPELPPQTASLRPARSRRTNPVGVSESPRLSQPIVRLTGQDLRTVAEMLRSPGSPIAGLCPQVNVPILGTANCHDGPLNPRHPAPVNGELVPAPKSLPPMIQALQSHDCELDITFELMAKLFERLNPCLSVVPETANGKEQTSCEGEPRSGSSSVVNAVRHYTLRQADLNDQLRHLIGRIEL